MLSIKIIAVGVMKSPELSSLVSEYVKRLRPFARVSIVEIPHEKFSSVDEKEKVTAREAEKILAVISSLSRDPVHLVALEERGKEFDSPTFARTLAKLGEQGQTICFMIGGALGLHSSIRARAKLVISLSQLTFPHEMARVILLEQLYRASCIMTGKTYHY